MDVLVLLGSFTLLCALGVPVAYALGLGAIIAAHMFDPNFSGNENPIDAITIDLTELSRRTVGDRVEVTCTQTGEVLTLENNGWSFDTRIVIEIVPDPDEPGLFQVIKQTEIDAV